MRRASAHSYVRLPDRRLLVGKMPLSFRATSLAPAGRPLCVQAATLDCRSKSQDWRRHVECRAVHLLASHRAAPAKLTLVLSSARGSRRAPRRAQEEHPQRMIIPCNVTPRVDVHMRSPPRTSSMEVRRMAATSSFTRPCRKNDLNSAKKGARDASNSVARAIFLPGR